MAPLAPLNATPPLQTLQILLVEDSEDDAELIALALRRAGVRCAVRRVDTEPAMREVMAGWAPDVVLCDYHLPRFSCHGALALTQSMRPGVPVLIVSRHIDLSEEAAALHHGASGCVRKNRLEQLAGAVRQAVHPDLRPGPPTEAA